MNIAGFDFVKYLWPAHAIVVVWFCKRECFTTKSLEKSTKHSIKFWFMIRYRSITPSKTDICSAVRLPFWNPELCLSVNINYRLSLTAQFDTKWGDILEHVSVRGLRQIQLCRAQWCISDFWDYVILWSHDFFSLWAN